MEKPYFQLRGLLWAKWCLHNYTPIKLTKNNYINKYVLIDQKKECGRYTWVNESAKGNDLEGDKHTLQGDQTSQS